MSERCMSRYERGEPIDQRTHTCDLDAPHVADGPHHCPTCGSWWKAYLGVVPAPQAAPKGGASDE